MDQRFCEEHYELDSSLFLVPKINVIYNCIHNVLEAKLVSSCFNCPSNASPHLSLLFASNGVSSNTLESVKPGCMVLPSLDEIIQYFCISIRIRFFLIY